MSHLINKRKNFEVNKITSVLDRLGADYGAQKCHRFIHLKYESSKAVERKVNFKF
jgi:hypothetical protein